LPVCRCLLGRYLRCGLIQGEGGLMHDLVGEVVENGGLEGGQLAWSEYAGGVVTDVD
jgi:hypothetical protein